MPYFLCRLASEDGTTLSKSFLAPTREDCRHYFEAEGFCILSVKRDWKRIEIPSSPFEKRIKDRDFIMFNQELIALLRAGYPVIKSIAIIAGRVKNTHLKEMLMQVEKEIRDGKALSEAFSAVGRDLPTVYIASLMAGERSGNLGETIGRFISYQKVITETKARIKRAFTYPALLLILSLGLMALIINFIIPRFSGFYADFDAELPLITRTLVDFSMTMRRYAPLILILVVGGGVALVSMRRREQHRVTLDRFKLFIPYGRKIWLDSAVSLFSRTLGLLLEGGISLIKSLAIARRAVPNRFLRQRLQNLPERIENGDSLSESLEGAGFIDPLALDMIRIGESSANLEGMLSETAAVFDDRIQARIDTFVSLVEPLIIIFMGLVVAVMLLAVYIPIFNIIKVTH